MLSRLLPFGRARGPSPGAGPAPAGQPETSTTQAEHAETADGPDTGHIAGDEGALENPAAPESEMAPEGHGTLPDDVEGGDLPSTSPLAVLMMDMRLDDCVGMSRPPNEHGPAAFHLFNQLPYDLRRRIWRTTMKRFRLVNITHDGPKVERATNSLGRCTSGVKWKMLNKMPAIFAVCQESRREATLFYRIHLPGERVYVNPEWDFVCYNVNKYALTFPIDAFLCNDLLAYDPMDVGVVHFGRKDSWRRSDGSFEKPGSPLYPLEVIKPLADSLRNLRSWTEVYTLPLAGERQETGGYYFPHWHMREGYFERDPDSIEKGAYVLPANREGYEAVLHRLRDMLGDLVLPAVKDAAVVGTFHIMPTTRTSLDSARWPGGVGGRVFVGQYGRLDRMMVE